MGVNEKEGGGHSELGIHMGIFSAISEGGMAYTKDWTNWNFVCYPARFSMRGYSILQNTMSQKDSRGLHRVESKHPPIGSVILSILWLAQNWNSDKCHNLRHYWVGIFGWELYGGSISKWFGSGGNHSDRKRTQPRNESISDNAVCGISTGDICKHSSVYGQCNFFDERNQCI